MKDQIANIAGRLKQRIKTLPLNIWEDYESRLQRDAVPRPQYGFCMYSAAILARALGYSKVSIIEFGVASGKGVLNMEYHACEIEKIYDIEFEIYGFDTSTGLPPSSDYRDVLHTWQPGFFKMNLKELEERLTRTKLFIGDVSDTLPKFLEKKTAPLGAASFDLDYYSSTSKALRIFDDQRLNSLPRITCYFDDIFGNNPFQALNEWVGQQLAIREFNREIKPRKITPMPQLHHMRKNPHIWNEKIYGCHFFNHEHYNTYIEHSFYKGRL